MGDLRHLIVDLRVRTQLNKPAGDKEGLNMVARLSPSTVRQPIHSLDRVPGNGTDLANGTF